MEMNIAELVKQFNSEDKCHAYLEHLRWPNGVRCPRCKSDKISRITARRQFDCDACRYQFSVRVGTIFHDSKLPLWQWLLAVYMMGESKKGISANQLKRMLKVSYKTAWYLCHRIRATMKQDGRQLGAFGIGEIDETMVGGKRRGVGSGNREGKVVVAGAAERGGRVRMKVIGDCRKRTLHRFIEENVHDFAREIHTDEVKSYKGIGDENTKHKSVNHSAGLWVHAKVHTNTVEVVWSLFKRSLVGSYHKVSAKHLPVYLDEAAFRYNNRDNDYLFRDTILRLISTGALGYQKLTA
jgi:transposase-like protein